MHEQTCCCDEAASHQLPTAAAFWIIEIVSVEECSSLTQNLTQIFCSTCSVILYAMATQYTCSLNSVYHPHWPVQWSRHCSCMCIPVSLAARLHWCHTNHSHYINNGWTISRQTPYISVFTSTYFIYLLMYLYSHIYLLIIQTLLSIWNISYIYTYIYMCIYIYIYTHTHTHRYKDSVL